MGQQSSTGRRRVGRGCGWARGVSWSGDGMRRAERSPSGSSTGAGSTARQEESHFRVSDSDRNAVVQDLSEHFESGRLDLEEFQERSARAMVARTRDDFTGLLSDLPPLRADSTVHHRRRGASWWVLVPVVAALAVAFSVAGAVAGPRHGLFFPWFLIPVGVFVAFRFRRHRRSPESGTS